MDNDMQGEQQHDQDSREMTETKQHLPPAIPASNPFEDVGREAARTIVGDILKFSKGDWLAGREGVEIPMGTRFIANMDQCLRGWVRWSENKPAEQIMGLVVESYVPPKRNTLGWGYTSETKKAEDVDTSDWEVDEQSGQPRDPWQETWYLLMRELDSEGKPLEGEGLYTFSASSKGGVDAIKELCGVYGKWMRLHPDKYPVVAIGYDSYEHPNPKLGRIKTPEFVNGFTSSEQARKGKKQKLFDPNKDWLPKAEFGEIDNAGPVDDDGVDVPF